MRNRNSKFNPVRDAEMFSRSFKTHFIEPGDIKAMVGWLEIPQNREAAVDAIVFAPDARRDDAFVDFIASSPEFQGWSRAEIQNALDKADDLGLMEEEDIMDKRKTTKGSLEKLIAEAVHKGMAKARLERHAVRKVTRISSGHLAESIRRTVKKVLREMHASEIVGYTDSDGSVYCVDHMSRSEAERMGLNPIFAAEEGWEDMVCDVHDKDYAELAGNSRGIHTLGQVAGLTENRRVSKSRTLKKAYRTESASKRSSSTFGQIPSSEELQQAIDDLGGWDMELRGSDLETFVDAVEAAGMGQMKAMNLMKTGEGMARVLRALMSSEDEKAEELASSILDVLGWEWV